MTNKPSKYNAILLADYTPPPFFIETANLQFVLDPQATVVTAVMHIKRNLAAPSATNTSLQLNGVDLQLQEIKLDNQLLAATAYTVDAEQLTILQPPDDFILETKVKICPEQNFACTGLYLTNSNFCTQNEPHGFRRITYFFDRPDILTKFTTTIIADENRYPVLLSNGNLISQTKLTNNQHQAVWQDPYPKSPYLFALVAGNFAKLEDYYTTGSGRKITLRIFADPKQLEQCNYAMLFLKQAMAWDEQNFGLEYDLDLYQIVAINDLNFGAMENKGLNVFNASVLLATKDTATDADFRRIAAVIAHEYFHNWTGNRVTCRNWFQIGLKEGLTTLREQLFMEDLYGQTTNRISTIKAICTKQFAEDSGPLVHPVRLQSYIEINNFYTYTVYNKSAEIARMLITIFGRKVFVQILCLFLTRFDGQAVTIEDFLQVAAEVTHADLEQFKLWYDQSGTPQLNISADFVDNVYSLNIRQERPKAAKDFYIPLAVGFLNPTGDQILTEILVINKAEQNFSFKNFATKPIPSLLRNFSAPVKVNYSYNEDELVFLICHDQDPVNRWEASQKLMTKVIVELCAARRQLLECHLPPGLIQIFKTILGDNNIDRSLAAEILQLPSTNYLLETLSAIKIEDLYYVREFIKTELARQLKDELLSCYQANNSQQPYNITALSIAQRELKNTVLDYLIQLNTTEVFTICCQQLEQSDNLTDTIASLVALANSNYEQRERVLAQYYQKWQDQPNLTNKWLAINANIKLPETLQRVKKLLNHPAFNLKNPNKVLSLLRTFCENNHINFHVTSGEGYQFLADQIITIDKFNPNLAALITTPLTGGSKLDKTRQQLLQQQLIRVNQEPGLSKNVYEITAKAII